MQKTLGFILLAVGIGVIGYSLFSSYLIFTGSNDAPEIFPIVKEKTASPNVSVGSLEDLQNQLPDLLGQQLSGLLPTGAVPQMLNFGLWSMFASLLLFGGSLIAGIGVKLVK
ncbi:MAG: hypothetical protein O3C23_01460 [bacterium]|nr:hypothetical protein [bacterium]